MKKMFIATLLMTVSSYGFAADPAPEPSVLGKWELTSRDCTSNAKINDGIKIGEDKIEITNNSDNSFEYSLNVGGCLTIVKGTYTVDGRKVDYTSTTSQSCKDAAPTPMVDTQSMFVAYLSGTEAVTVTTGDKAAMSCPAGDALIMHFMKEVTQQ